MRMYISLLIGILVSIGMYRLYSADHGVDWKHELEVSRQRAEGTCSIKDSGVYGVYLRQLPLLKVWNRWKALEFLRQRLGETTAELMMYYDHGLPFLITRDHDDANQIKCFLEGIGCTVDVIELQFNVRFS